jgi:hypothetical protein
MYLFLVPGPAVARQGVTSVAVPLATLGSGTSTEAIEGAMPREVLE